MAGENSPKTVDLHDQYASSNEETPETNAVGGRWLTPYASLGMVAASLGGLLYGVEIGFGVPALQMNGFRKVAGYPTVEDAQCGQETVPDPKWVADEIGWLNSCFVLVALASSIVAGFLADKYGRRFVLWSGCILYAAGGLIEGLAGLQGGNPVDMMYVGRVLTGGGNGFICMIAPLYGAELSPSHWRGKTVTFFQLFITVGIFFGGLANMWLSTIDWGWRVAWLTQCVVAIVLFILTVFLPESPRFHVKIGKMEAALTTLRKLAGAKASDGDDALTVIIAKKEVQDIASEVNRAEKAGRTSWTELFKGTSLTTLILGVGLGACQKTTGINWVMNYYPTIARQLCVAPFVANCLNSAVNMLSTFLALPMIDRFGRKTLMVWMTLLIIPAFVGVACLFFLVDDFKAHPGAGWAVVVFISIFTFAFATSWGPMGWLVPAEIFPIHQRGKGMGLATSANMILDFALNTKLSIIITQPDVWGVGGTAIFFLVLALLTALPMVFFWQAETKNVTMEEIRLILNYKAGGGGPSGAGTWSEYVKRNWKQSVDVMTCRTVDPKEGSIPLLDEQKERDHAAPIVKNL